MEKRKNELWAQYHKMVYHQANHYAKKFGLDYDDMIEAGLYWFVRAYETWDETKASFSTHLFSKLRGIQDEACRIIRVKNREHLLGEGEDYIDDRDSRIDYAEFYDAIAEHFNENILAIVKKAKTKYGIQKALKKLYKDELKAQTIYTSLCAFWKKYTY